jgi:hypothetical protein
MSPSFTLPLELETFSLLSLSSLSLSLYLSLSPLSLSLSLSSTPALFHSFHTTAYSRSLRLSLSLWFPLDHERFVLVSSTEWGETYALLMKVVVSVGLFVFSRLLVNNHYAKSKTN